MLLGYVATNWNHWIEKQKTTISAGCIPLELLTAILLAETTVILVFYYEKILSVKLIEEDSMQTFSFKLVRMDESFKLLNTK
jgi:hypothetical protein